MQTVLRAGRRRKFSGRRSALPPFSNTGAVRVDSRNLFGVPSKTVHRRPILSRVALSSYTQIGLSGRIGSLIGNGSRGFSEKSNTTYRNDPEDSATPKDNHLNNKGGRRAVFVAFGSNVGDRLGVIEQACNAVSATHDIEILRTSGLWETQPMYVKDQGTFLNGVMEVQTELKPLELLDRLQSIENELGRRKTIDKGPRNIDLDILLYGDLLFDHERLTIPHKLMLERGFVLHPLCELIPNAVCPGDPLQNSFSHYLEALPETEYPETLLTPLSGINSPIHPLSSRRSTRIMSVLNVTPDSFSDGGLNIPSIPKSIKATAEQHLAGGASIIDVGGESTRPHASPLTEGEELGRVIPTIEVINSLISTNRTCQSTLISIDTYHASVAEAAIKAGAHIVNDISAGGLDDEMFPTVAKLGCSIILMHMRGNPSTMLSAENTSYPDGLIHTVGEELRSRVEAAEAAGIRRWRILLDPGIGFAKNQGQNLEILRRLTELRNHRGLEGLPWVVGASRKRFIGHITGVEVAKERVWGTATATSAAIQGGADIVRVHDVAEMAKVAKMADAVWRT